MHSRKAICFDLLFLLCKRAKSLQELDSINIQVPTNYLVCQTTFLPPIFAADLQEKYLLFFGFISGCHNLWNFAGKSSTMETDNSGFYSATAILSSP